MSIRWLQRGLLLPAPVTLTWASSHAALPHAHPLEDGRIRLFFSSRDERGRSHIGRAEIDLASAGGAAHVFDEAVLHPGPLGAFDDSGVVRHVSSGGSRRFLYYTGWSRGVTVPFYLPPARDQRRRGPFERLSAAPLLERSAVDPFVTASPFVLVEDDRWRMWYVSGRDGVACRQAASSLQHPVRELADGITWQRRGLVCIDYAAATSMRLAVRA